jgi:hypothetical protein
MVVSLTRILKVTEKRFEDCINSWGVGIHSDTKKYPEFSYQDRPPSPRQGMMCSRDNMPRYTTGAYLDLTGSHMSLQIPSWAITEATLYTDSCLGSRASTYLYGVLPGL